MKTNLGVARLAAVAALTLLSTAAAAAGGGKMPASVANRLRASFPSCAQQQGDFALVMCARPRIWSNCQNLHAQASNCSGAAAAVRKAQECMNKSRTDGGALAALNAYDAANAAFAPFKSRCYKKPTGEVVSCDQAAAQLGGFRCNKNLPPARRGQLNGVLAAGRREVASCRRYLARKQSAAAGEAAHRASASFAEAGRICNSGASTQGRPGQRQQH